MDINQSPTTPTPPAGFLARELWVLKAAVDIVPNTIRAIRNFRVASLHPRNLPSTVGRSIQKTDMFGYSPIVQFDSFRSFFGGFLSACCIVGIIIYMIITATRFFDSPVPKSQVDIYADSLGIETPLIGIRFNAANGSALYDDTWFTFTMTLNIITGSNTRNRTIIPLNLTECDYYKYADDDYKPYNLSYLTPVAEKVICLDRTKNTWTINGTDYELGNLTGAFEDKMYRYIEVSMVECAVNGTVSKQPCSPTRRDDILKGNVNVMWYNKDVQDVEGVDANMRLIRSWKSYRFTMAPGQIVNKDIYITKSVVTHTSAWPLGEDDVVTTYRETRMIDAISAFQESNRRFLKYIWRTDDRMRTELWGPATIFDLIGSWGAFWSSLLLIFGTLGALYNEKKWEFLVSTKQLEVDAQGAVFEILGQKIGRNPSSDKIDLPDVSRRPTITAADFLAMKRRGLSVSEQTSDSKYTFRSEEPNEPSQISFNFKPDSDFRQDLELKLESKASYDSYLDG
eukprot:TRINITY_DN6042_c0_g1_i1.p1 TRINITY_DN6042_c0_g1~~TRINITY_DN6042_c0_g1_i1.p1  ORF type:complete len:511 (-),score=106.32 TRINITY_DN6042_c0_g1_i1:83-1615(-)